VSFNTLFESTNIQKKHKTNYKKKKFSRSVSKVIQLDKQQHNNPSGQTPQNPSSLSDKTPQLHKLLIKIYLFLQNINTNLVAK